VIKLVQSKSEAMFLYPEPEMATDEPRPALFGVSTRLD
jgi:hypothetical protein